MVAWRERALSLSSSSWCVFAVPDVVSRSPHRVVARLPCVRLSRVDSPPGVCPSSDGVPEIVSQTCRITRPFTAALAGALAEPGLKVEDVFKRVRVAVEGATNGQQTPWESSSLRGDFYFVAEAPEAPEPATVTVTETVPSELTVQQLAARAYEAAERLHTVASYRLVVERFSGHALRGVGRAAH